MPAAGRQIRLLCAPAGLPASGRHYLWAGFGEFPVDPLPERVQTVHVDAALKQGASRCFPVVPAAGRQIRHLCVPAGLPASGRHYLWPGSCLSAAGSRRIPS
ncbi:hypothetical protein C9412_18995 [Stenotrophomonas sp. Nf1]|nr:hypothetical protein C9412_18995 [Stenotrophomonas sp. Nf1]